MVKVAGIFNKKGNDELSTLKVKCKCGHVIIISVQVDSTICSHCRRKVMNNTKEHFKYKLRKLM